MDDNIESILVKPSPKRTGKPRTTKKVKNNTQAVMASQLPAVANMLLKATANRPGQPTKKTPELIDSMCLLMSRGLSLMMVCGLDGMPGYSTVMRWQNEDDTLIPRFDKAREMTAYTLDEMNELIARNVAPFATGEFRRDELIIAINNQRKRTLNRKRFQESSSIDVNSAITITMPEHFLPKPTQTDFVEGQVIDPDAVFEQETIDRILEDARKDSDVSSSHDQADTPTHD